MVSYIIEYTQPEAGQVDLAGGKLSGLAWLRQAGVPVPAGFGVASTANRDWLQRSGAGAELAGLLRRIRPTDGDLATVEFAAVEQAAEQLLASVGLPEDISDQIAQRYRALGRTLGVDDPPVAVRSSATVEDATVASFAGEYETYLGVQGVAAVCEHVVKCWTSAFSRQALTYAARQGIDVATAGMGVVVQSMVPAAAAGVIFTLSPTTGDRSRIVIEASWGLGTAVVGGEVTPDRYVVDKTTLEVVSVEVADKTVEHQLDGRVVPVDTSRRTARCLSDDEVRELANAAKRLEREHRHALDLEWALDPRLPFPDNLVLLQCRPETTWSNRRTKGQDRSGSVLDMIVRASGVNGR